MSHRSLITGAILVTYYAVSAYGLFLFDAGLLVTQLILFGIPAYVLARATMAPSPVLVSVAAFGLGLGLLLEGVAHIYGLWYSIGLTELRILSIIPLEMLFAIMLQSLFLVLAYEALFDNAQYTLRSARERLSFFGVFAIGALVLIALHYFLIDGWLLSYSYVWVIGTLVAAAVAALTLHKAVSIRFIDKVVDFSLVAAMPLAISLWLSVENVHKVFAHTSEYLQMMNFFGVYAPVEEIVLLFAFPFLVATIYELYLDDRS